MTRGNKNTKSTLSRLTSWGLFLTVLLTVGTGFNPGSLKRCGCSVSPEEAAQLRDLAGRVLAVQDNAPIPGAQVDLSGRGTTSNGLGEFLFRDVDAGTYRLMVTAPGFKPHAQSLIWPSPGDDPLTILLRTEGTREMALPVRDAKTSLFDPVTNFAEEDRLCFEWGAGSLAGLARYYAFIDFNQAVLPPGATIERVLLHGTRFPSTNTAGGGGGGGGGGDGGNEENPRRYGLASAQDDIDIVFDAYAVLEAWDEAEINFLNRPREYSVNPVASVTLPPMTGDAFDFVMDLTQFAKDRQSGRLRAAGFILTGRDVRSLSGDLHFIASSEYLPAEKALRVVAEYTDAAGNRAQVVLR